MGKKICLFLLVLSLCSLLLTGCFSYQDINRVIFATATIVDYVNDEMVLYVEAFHSYRSNKSNNERGERLYYKSSGITLNDASRQINKESSYKLDYTQNKVLIVTRRAAEHGITDFIDFYDRFQGTLIRAHILVMEGEPEELLRMELKEDEYVGLYLYELLENPAVGISNLQDRINQFYNYRLMGDRVSVVSMLEMDHNGLEDKLKVENSAIFQRDKMVYTMTVEERKAYHIMVDIAKRGLINFTNPVTNEGYVSLDPLKSKTKTDISFDGSRITLTKTINFTSDLVGVQVPMELNNEALQKIKEASEEVIRQNCEDLFYKYQELDLDVFDVKENFHRKYPHEKVENPLKVTTLKVIVNNNLEGSTNITDFVK